MFCSGGADGKAFLFDGKTGEKTSSLGGDKAHTGGIYAVSGHPCVVFGSFDKLMAFFFIFVKLSFGPDGRQLLTASGDKTCKLWDVETSQVVTLVYS